MRSSPKLGTCSNTCPFYFPDLNLIEHKWAQSKALRRKSQCSIENLFNENALWIIPNWLGYISAYLGVVAIGL